MARETSLWSWLSQARTQLAPNVFGEPALHIQRIENLTGAGTPDVEGFVSAYWNGDSENLTEHHGQFWLELKSHVRPARARTPIRFPLKGRDAQIEFMRRRWSMGGNAYWLLQVGEGADRVLYLAPGDVGAKLANGLTEAELAVECAVTGCVFPRRVKAGDVICRAVKPRFFNR